jgi:hypothetical protein
MRTSELGPAEELDALLGVAAEVREDLADVIAARERLRDEDLEHLSFQAGLLVDQIEELERAKLVVELQCFRDVLALHRAGHLGADDARRR